MRTFFEWLTAVIQEARRPYIDPGVLAGYEHAFTDQLKNLIRRTHDPRLRAVLTDMLDCPIRSGHNCRSFTDFIVGALIRNGIHHRYDMEAALGYIAEKLLMDRTRGEPRASLFSGFTERPDYAGGNPVLARFLQFLQWSLNNIKKGKIPRLSNVEQRPQGTVSIGLGRQKDGDPASGISPDEIEARPSGDRDLAEMIQDIEALLRKKELAYGFPLVNLFRAIMGGMNVHQQQRQFGDRKVRTARQVIVDTIRQYAQTSGNAALLHLLQRLQDGQDRQEAPTRTTQVTSPQPVLTDQQRDYASVAQVVARFERRVGSADLGRFRRRWLEYPARTPGSGFRNRLEEVLSKMVKDGVLKTTRTRAGATVYEPGPNFEQYHQVVGVGV